MTRFSAELPLRDEAHTRHLAAALGAHLRPGDVILLSGDIGAGKTAFARALIGSLQEAPEDVPSPTFTLVQVYDTRRGEVWHADLYRIARVSEIEELGLSEAFAAAICLIEWPDRLGDLTPPGALDLTLTAGPEDDTRIARLSWADPRWSAPVGEVVAALGTVAAR